MPDGGVGEPPAPGIPFLPEPRVDVAKEDGLLGEAGRLPGEFVEAAGALLDSLGRDGGRFCDHLLEGCGDGFPRALVPAAAGRRDEARGSGAGRSATPREAPATSA